MLNSILDSQLKRDVYFIHAARNSRVHAFKEHVLAITKENKQVKSFFVYDNPSDGMDCLLPNKVTLDIEEAIKHICKRNLFIFFQANFMYDIKEILAF